MSRGLGTASGVALMTFCLHLTGKSGPGVAGPRLAVAALGVASLAAACTGLAVRRQDTARSGLALVGDSRQQDAAGRT